MKKKIIVGLILIVMNILMINSFVYSANAEDYINPIINANNSASLNSQEGENAIKKIIGIVLDVVKIVALGIAIIMLTYLAIKYMSAAPNERANIKTNMITFAIGAVLVFGAAEILTKVMNISKGIFG